MRTIARSYLRAYAETNPASEKDLMAWYKTTSEATWNNFAELKQTFPQSDLVKGTDRVVFDVHGNKYRIVAAVDYQRHGVLIRFVGTHEEYDALGSRIKTI